MHRPTYAGIVIGTKSHTALVDTKLSLNADKFAFINIWDNLNIAEHCASLV